MEKRSESNRNDYIALFLLILLAVGVFVWELLSPPSETTQREEILFKAFELLFSASIGWVLQRIQSRDDFRKNIKQFAISAYRRIIDRERAVQRLSNDLVNDIANGPSEEINRVQGLLGLVEGISDTVNSSAADWADILDEEIKKKDKIQGLEEERNLLENTLRIENLRAEKADAKFSVQFKQLTDEINKLKSELPQMLRSDLVSSDENYPREGRFSQIVYNYFYHSVQAQSSIVLLIHAFFEITDQNWGRISGGKSFFFYEEGVWEKLFIL